MNLTKITGTDCIVLISNKLMQILNYDSTVKHAISTTKTTGSSDSHNLTAICGSR